MSLAINTLTSFITTLAAGTPTPTDTATPTGTVTPTATITPTPTAVPTMPVSQLEKVIPKSAIDTTANLLFSGAALLIALIAGLVLRRLLVHRLKKTVLDNWIIQTLGILVIIPPLILGGVVSLAIWSNLLQIIENLRNTYHIDLITFGINLVETLILIALGIGVARTIKNVTLKGFGDNRIDVNIRTFLGRITSIIALIILGFWILAIWQISIGIPVAVVGAITVVFTVSIQDIVKDLVAGFYILIERPFHIGDQISINTGLATYVGKVQDIQPRATKLRLITGEEITVPNTIVFSNAVINNTYYGERRATIAVTLPESEFSQEETPTLILKALQELEQILEKPEPSVILSSFSEEKLTLLVRFWIASSHTIDVSDAAHALHVLLPKGEITVREPAT